LRIHRRFVAASSVAVAAAAALMASGACTTDTATLPYTPITGIIIRSQGLVAGIGCGLGPDQVYRYAAVLNAETTDGGVVPNPTGTAFPLTTIFDCFADGAFENLPTNYGSTYELQIYAYTQDAYVNTAKLPANLGCAAADACAAFGGALTTPQTVAATWTTTCSGTQIAGSPVDATCGVLQRRGGLPDASPDDGSTSGDSATTDSGGAAPDTGAETSTDGSLEAGEASTGDADTGDSGPDSSAGDGAADGN
jgi:hypothetical protein